MHVIALLQLLLYDSADAGGMSFGAVLLGLFFVAIAVAIYWRIAMKAGYPGWYSLAAFVPLVNLVVIVLFAFTEWPIESELKLLRAMALRKTAS